MKRNRSTQLKSGFILIIFSLNMVIGFACAVGIKMGFNSCHEEKFEKITTKASHQHDKKQSHHKSKSCKDNCCNDHVVKISQVEKSLPQSFAGINPVLLATLISSFYNIDVLSTRSALANTKYFIRGHHPPIPDIRISIRSFQI